MRIKILAFLTLLIIPLVYAETYEELNKKFDKAVQEANYSLVIILGKEILKEDTKDIELIYHYGKMGDAFIALGNPDDPIYDLTNSLEYYGKAEQLINNSNNEKGLIQEFFVSFYWNYGVALLLNKSYHNSEQKLLKAYNISKELNIVDYQIQVLTNLGRLYSIIGEFNKTIWTIDEREKLGAEVKNKEFIMGFAKAILDKESKIDFKEIWDIMPYNSSHYSVKIQLNIDNKYHFDFLSPIMDWSFHLFNPDFNYEYKENNIEGEGNPTFFNMILFSGTDIKKTNLIERIFPYPQQGMKLINNKTKQANITFLYQKEDLNIFASRNTVLVKGLKVNYEKLINIYTNDEIFSEFPSQRWIYEDHYVMYFNKNLIGINPNDLVVFSHSIISYFPYIDKEDSFGTIFGLKKPLFKRIWLNEEINLNKVNENRIIGLITHKERLDFQNKDALKYIGVRLFFVGDNIGDISIEPVDGIPIKGPISATLNEYNPQYQENQAYISNKEGETRYLFFWINTSKKEVELEINYPIELSKYIEQINEYTWRLEYQNIFYPGLFPLYYRQYSFILPEDYRVLSSSSKTQINQNIVTFNFAEDFKLREQISFIFKDLNLEQKFIEKNVSDIQTTTWILTSLFILVLSFIHYKYKRKRIFLTFLTIPLSFLILSILDLTKYIPFVVRVRYYYIGLFLLLSYGLVSYCFYKINTTNAES
ncbi:hypothetical protein HYU09_04920 [Candidatus Woesearchaeota archaeon]|nr:hypothetical protein [Candidatus Woesearchaeota archaeon]